MVVHVTLCHDLIPYNLCRPRAVGTSGPCSRVAARGGRCRCGGYKSGAHQKGSRLTGGAQLVTRPVPLCTGLLWGTTTEVAKFATCGLRRPTLTHMH